ncbi:MAG: multidrug ABC transporter [Atopobiaceae bacterium]|nr:multidrug ABC transporter [Atopobiaceae bacterium]MCH4181393.1 multidrug ABC transporter [Atopobiaceae bacterium]MCH4215123.1 multidrug ABC transporter [Atopobiaceae bacterium]MCH4230264.1 multidrug ABC transporter [Atopobiaceae bacterium]MCH4276910.1 multidrug ABC transporter [Atopobiaceae bacterium]
MNGIQWGYAAVLLVSVFVSAVSQVMLKKASQRTYASTFAEYANPLVVSAYAIFVGTTLLTVLAYQGIPLSLGPVLEATSYVYVTIFGVTIFHEHVGRQKLVALALILAGIAVFAVLG